MPRPFLNRRCHRATGRLWAIDARSWPYRNRVSVTDELGYWLAPPGLGRGASVFEAVRAAVEHWFDHGAANIACAPKPLSGQSRSALLLWPVSASSRPARAHASHGRSRREVIAPGHAADPGRLDDAPAIRCPDRSPEAPPARAHGRPLPSSSSPRHRSRAWSPLFPSNFTPRRRQGLHQQAALARTGLGFLRRRRRAGGLSESAALAAAATVSTSIYFLGEDHGAWGYAREASWPLVDELIRRFRFSAIHARTFTDTRASARFFLESVASSGSSNTPAPPRRRLSLRPVGFDSYPP